MFLLAQAADATAALDRTAVVSTLDGVTTALTLFVFAALIYPAAIKRRRQFFLVVFTLLGVVILHALTLMLRSTAFTVFAGVLTGVLQAAGIGLAVMAAGGLNAEQLSEEMKRSYEVLRRGETEKEIIIPIAGGAGPKKSAADEPARTVYTIDTPPGPAARPTPADRSIPLE